ncbi:MAG: hypothetical protein AB1610_02155 [Nitrospirota bacterium]
MIKRGYLEALEFYKVLNIISGFSNSDASKKSILEIYPLTGFPEILNVIEISLDNEGNILDAASIMLSQVRSHIRNLDKMIRKKLEEIIRDKKLSLFLQ